MFCTTRRQTSRPLLRWHNPTQVLYPILKRAMSRQDRLQNSIQFISAAWILTIALVKELSVPSTYLYQVSCRNSLFIIYQELETFALIYIYSPYNTHTPHENSSGRTREPSLCKKVLKSKKQQSSPFSLSEILYHMLRFQQTSSATDFLMGYSTFSET